MDRREMDRREKRGRDDGCEEEGEVRRGKKGRGGIKKCYNRAQCENAPIHLSNSV